MKTIDLTEADRKKILTSTYPVIFNISVVLVLGLIVILIIPNIIKESILLIQVIFLILLVTFQVVYFLSKTKNQRADLRNNTVLIKREKLVSKNTLPNRTYKYYLPEDIKDNNTYELKFETKAIRVTKEVYENMSTGENYELNYSPLSKIFLSISN